MVFESAREWSIKHFWGQSWTLDNAPFILCIYFLERHTFHFPYPCYNLYIIVNYLLLQLHCAGVAVAVNVTLTPGIVSQICSCDPLYQFILIRLILFIGVSPTACMWPATTWASCCKIVNCWFCWQWATDGTSFLELSSAVLIYFWKWSKVFESVILWNEVIMTHAVCCL